MNSKSTKWTDHYIIIIIIRFIHHFLRDFSIKSVCITVPHESHRQYCANDLKWLM